MMTRNLYKIRDAARRVVAFITACGEVDALTQYREAGGDVDQVFLEQVSHGYPDTVCTVYA